MTDLTFCVCVCYANNGRKQQQSAAGFILHDFGNNPYCFDPNCIGKDFQITCSCFVALPVSAQQQ